MADPTQGQDPSMEDILASIRRIIDEDERKAPGVSAPAAPVYDDEDDDVLDLTDAVEEAPDDAPDQPESDGWDGDDEVMPDDAEVVAPAVDEGPEPEAYLDAGSTRAHDSAQDSTYAAAPSPAAASHEDTMTASHDERLVSEAAYSSAAAALGSLARASERDPLDGIQRGRPVEDLVMELLRPMLREWLDENLPTIVERVVEREVRYLSRRAEGGDRA